MDNKVKELMEWAKLTPQEMANAIVDNPDLPMRQAIAKAQREKIFNNPDLALIDREKERPNVSCVNLDRRKRIDQMVIAYWKAGFTHSIIPLAEALKEVKNA